MNDKYIDKLRKIQLEILDEIDRVCKKNDIKYFLSGGTLLGAVRHGGFIPWDDDIDIAMSREDYDKFCSLDSSEFGDEFLLNCFKTNKKCNYPFAKLVRKNTNFIEMQNVGAPSSRFDGIWVDVFPLDEVCGIGEPLQEKNKKIHERYLTLINIKNNTNYYRNSKIKKKIYHFILLFVPMKFLKFKLEKAVTSESKKEGAKYLCSYSTVYSIVTDTHAKDIIFPLKTIKFEGKEYPCMNNNDQYLKNMYGDYMKLPPENERRTHHPYYIKFPDGEEIYPND